MSSEKIKMKYQAYLPQITATSWRNLKSKELETPAGLVKKEPCCKNRRTQRTLGRASLLVCSKTKSLNPPIFFFFAIKFWQKWIISFLHCKFKKDLYLGTFWAQTWLRAFVYIRFIHVWIHPLVFLYSQFTRRLLTSVNFAFFCFLCHVHPVFVDPLSAIHCS